MLFFTLVTVLPLVLVAALVLVASAPPPRPRPQNVFGFSEQPRAPDPRLPDLLRHPARDGEQLAYRFYEASTDRLMIFVHGSSYHSGGYHTLARAVAEAGLAKVVMPNMRGHYMSGPRRGDVDYIGQYEDDVADLIAHLREQGFGGPITLAGHSSGGGFVVRFAGGTHAKLIDSFLPLAPVLPLSPSIRGGSSGGWALAHLRRIYGLVILNIFGIHGFDALPMISFNKPPEYWDGTETLSYSWRLNASYHPRPRWAKDLAALPARTHVLIGADDQAIDAEKLRELVAKHAPGVAMSVLPGVDHFGIFRQEQALVAIRAGLKAFD